MDIELMAEIAQKLGLKRLRIDEIEIEFWEKPRERYSQAVPVGALVDESGNQKEDIDDELLFYSAE